MKTLEVQHREAWRRWLAENHSTRSEIWLVFLKGSASGVSYSDALDDALCFGWVDSLVKRIDDRRYARKFTPRKAESKWSTVNREKYADLLAQGLIAPPGLARAPTARNGDAPRPSAHNPPKYLAQVLRANPTAWKHFERLAPSYRRRYIAWIDAAKQPQTRERRIKEAIRLLSEGKKLGLK